jgi:hypothetical protein
MPSPLLSPIFFWFVGTERSQWQARGWQRGCQGPHLQLEQIPVEFTYNLRA